VEDNQEEGRGDRKILETLAEGERVIILLTRKERRT